VIPIDPDRGARSNLAIAGAVLDRGNGLIWFPEGQRSADGELQRFRPGIGLLLERFPRPVVLGSIRGSHEAMPLGRRLPRPHRIEIAFSEPIDPRRLAGEGGGEGAAGRIVDGLHERMVALQSAHARGERGGD
jgi:long-chain acyl-CoA synthetase